MKVGKEVEGRHIGLNTLFCSQYELMDNPQRVAQAAEDWKVHQIYISDLENALDVSDLNSFLGTLALNYVVTVECSIIPEYIAQNINIMLNIDCPSFWNLRLHDQIKFSQNQTVYAATVDNMTFTDPSAFEGDIEID